MSPNSFFADNGRSARESITLTDEVGRSLECYVEQTFSRDNTTYYLLLPVDAPVSIVAWDEDENSDEATLIEDEDELDRIFPDAKAVLAEQNLVLKQTAFTPTVAGELPSAEEGEVLILEIEEEGDTLEPEELQLLANFFHEEEEFGVYAHLTPLLLFARQEPGGSLELLSPEEFKKIQPILEEWLFEDLE